MVAGDLHFALQPKRTRYASACSADAIYGRERSESGEQKLARIVREELRQALGGERKSWAGGRSPIPLK